MSKVSFLTKAIGWIASGPTAKARAAGVAGAIATAAQPAADAFLRGLQFGITPKLEELGTIIGAAVAGYLVTYATTWVAPKNTGK